MKNRLAYLSLVAVSALLIAARVMYQKASAQGVSLSELLFPPRPQKP